MTASSLKLMADVLRPPSQQNLIWTKTKNPPFKWGAAMTVLYLSKNEPWSYILVLHSSKIVGLHNMNRSLIIGCLL